MYCRFIVFSLTNNILILKLIAFSSKELLSDVLFYVSSKRHLLYYRKNSLRKKREGRERELSRSTRRKTIVPTFEAIYCALMSICHVFLTRVSKLLGFATPLESSSFMLKEMYFSLSIA